jgi:acetolactate synthase small subunit
MTKKVIESGFSKASEIDRNDLLEYKEKKINKRVPLVITYHPSLEKISGIVRHHWKEMEKSETLTKLFPKPPVVAFRRPKSIKDTLVRAAVSRPSSTVGSVNHVVTSVASAVSNCNTHKCSIARRQERSIRSFAMSIAKHLMLFTSLTVTSAGRNT